LYDDGKNEDLAVLHKLPHKSFFDYMGMSPEREAEFHAWYDNTQKEFENDSTKTYILRDERLAYCKQVRNDKILSIVGRQTVKNVRKNVHC
jgi:hypothetical protein